MRVGMRVCCVTVLAALALRTSAEPAARRHPAEWRARDRDLAPLPLHEIFEPEPAPGEVAYARAPPPLPAGALRNERRRPRNNKRASHQFPTEIASQMMLRASRSSRPYDVPQIGK